MEREREREEGEREGITKERGRYLLPGRGSDIM